MSSEERSSLENGIWLCCTCAKFVDDDAITYPADLLHKWKVDAEARARDAIERRFAQVPDHAQTSLSKQAVMILVNGIDDVQGQIYAHEMLHGFVILTNGGDLVENKLDHRAVARWREAMRELQRFRLIEQSDNRGEFFRVTDVGYQVAERLRP